MKQVVTVRRRALEANDAQADVLRRRFADARTLVLNLISSPGSGKTTLLEATVSRLSRRLRCAVVEGDVETERDADRIRALGAPAHQIPTFVAAVAHATVPVEELAKRLRMRPYGVFARIHEGRVVFDPRTLQEGEVAELAKAVREAAGSE